MRLIYLAILLLNFSLNAQNTIGVLSNSEKSFNGYTLFTAQTETYLINNCGEVINQWSSEYQSGKSVYLLKNGNLLRAAKFDNSNINFGGVGGRIELFDWEGNLTWEYNYSTDQFRQHHDIFPLPNGNILMLAVTVVNKTNAIQLGRNPANLPEDELYNEQILELEPIGTNSANVVWEWNIIDHLIQDFDNSKDNFGVISENPQLIDINFLGLSNGNANWLHVNSIQYNAQLDQIILSTRHFNEIYIIDHSTTTLEASTHLGGIYGKGGDILYRWGNPITYKQGTNTDQKLYGQHYPHWIPQGFTDEDKIILFNNGFNRDTQFSEVNILNPPTDSPGFYSYNANTAFGPENPFFIYTNPVTTDFYSPILSSAQRLQNGNTLICEGTSGHFFEIDSNNTIVWQYINPAGASGIMSQGDNPDFSANSIFRVKKYAPEYAAFNGKDLTPGLPIEINPDLSNCDVLSIKENIITDIKIFPNPVENLISIKSKEKISKIEVFNLFGKIVHRNTNKNRINISDLTSGIYMLKIHFFNKVVYKKIIKT